jgi:hypothetical protein
MPVVEGVIDHLDGFDLIPFQIHQGEKRAAPKVVRHGTI